MKIGDHSILFTPTALGVEGVGHTLLQLPCLTSSKGLSLGTKQNLHKELKLPPHTPCLDGVSVEGHSFRIR